MLEHRSRNRFWPTLLVVLIVCGALTAFHKRALSASVGDSDGATSIIRRAILAPAARGVESVKSWTADTLVALFIGPRLARENSALREQVGQLTLNNHDLNDAAAENIRLRGLLDFRVRTATPLLAAEVIALKPSMLRDTLMLNRGLRDGVRRKMCVLDPSGALIGQVIDVTATTCDVMLLTDDLSSVGVATVPAKAADSTAKPRKSVLGICQGERSPTIKLIDIPQDADILPGDAVKTSGLGDIYPNGIPVGRVTRVQLDRSTFLKDAEVKPNANFDQVQFAFVLLTQKTGSTDARPQ